MHIHKTTLFCSVAALLSASVALFGTGCDSGSSQTDMGGSTDLATLSCCGKPGDTGNSKGVGKYCTDPQGSECRANTGATVCSAIGNTTARKTFFCTMLCDPMKPAATECGENAGCTQDSGTKQYGCTPNACTSNLPPGCSA